ncbi:MAG TPA: DUF4230 domain-containing protein [Gemmatimonadales bacterium]|nr:DUF4230 domain-containing protein [Gemmatimonadales bacterium]
MSGAAPGGRAGAAGVTVGWLGLAVAGLLLVAAIYALRTADGWRRLLTGRTSITHQVALDRLTSVGKLVTTEAGLRDIVVYRDTRLGSTKKSLVVVTGKALVGIDLQHGARVDIDETARRIRLTVPHARLIGVDVIDLKTYDESRGLWNWFRPEDRDEIFGQARDQLRAAAGDMAVLEHAEQSARTLLTALFASDGYAVDVVFTPTLATPNR